MFNLIFYLVMKTEYKKVSELLALEDAEVLNEFEMVELQGGKDLLVCNNTDNNSCTVLNIGCDKLCWVGNGCHLNP